MGPQGITVTIPVTIPVAAGEAPGKLYAPQAAVRKTSAATRTVLITRPNAAGRPQVTRARRSQAPCTVVLRLAARWPSGKAEDFGSSTEGSNPSRATKLTRAP